MCSVAALQSSRHRSVCILTEDYYITTILHYSPTDDNPSAPRMSFPPFFSYPRATLIPRISSFLSLKTIDIFVGSADRDNTEKARARRDQKYSSCNHQRVIEQINDLKSNLTIVSNQLYVIKILNRT